MRRELENSILKAKIQIKQIGGFTKSLSEYGRVWTWIADFFEADSEYELENIDFQNFWKFYLFFVPQPTLCICMHAVERQTIMKFHHFWTQKIIRILMSIK